MNSDNTEFIPSPCIRQCCLDQQDICLGCHRSLKEILSWQNLTETQKADLVETLKARELKRSKPFKY
ncbi:DUF1289 domain-containing protein [Shewanella aestuarii]|uniref:DUF1289 domain-containing protein n=1 Tax=Shewanella aestuarii TaxID=1028752 RepID=A0A6G9QIU0_9GAMM|nr:DUF1289 domain-containing protein [Shewanella aestuarii]QIR14392.1 DUF1289 domain-containing protein [Shewanella aestuarii]